MIAVISLLTRSKPFNRLLTRWIKQILSKRTSLDLYDYAHLLHLHGDYRVTTITIDDNIWLTSKPLGQLHLRQEGIIV